MTSILVVEDHPVFVQSLLRLLQDRGQYQAVSAGSSEEALQRLQEVSPDLVLIDVSLPGISGIRLLQLIREQHPDLPCVMVSGHLAPHYVKQSMAAGALGYVLKEDIAGILEAVRAALEGKRYVSKAVQWPADD